jgi:nucleoside-diphosphate-sugar epimerase
MAKLRVLLIGSGDVALRAARLLSPRFRLYGLTRRPDQHAVLRAAGITPIAGDLDRRTTLTRLSISPFAVLHCAPPPASGDDDPRTRNLIAALMSARSLPRRFVYISTSGVYGDCRGAKVDETRPPSPGSARGRRRLAAESRLRRWGRFDDTCVTILRAPGIYSESRLPVERLHNATPALRGSEDVFTNHIHAEDLARACNAALVFGKPQRAYNVNDDAELNMGDYFDLVADRLGLQRPPRISLAEALDTLPPSMLSFMGESRRLVNSRAKRELRWRPLFPTPAETLDSFSRPRARGDPASSESRGSSATRTTGTGTT